MSDVPATRESEAHLLPHPTTALPTIGSDNGLLAWVASVDHKQIGLMYLLGALVFFLLAGLQALLMRLQLAFPANDWMSPNLYNSLFTMHGTTMVFFFGMPVVFGLANYLIPLMIGANDVAFPRLNALGLWLFVFSGLMLYFSFLAGAAPDMGWFGHPPLTLRAATTTQSTDYWALSLLVAGIGSVLGAVNLLVTIVTMRAPGMGFRRLPIFVWLSFFTMIIVLFALPNLNAALVMTLLDRHLGTRFFTHDPFVPEMSGDPLLYQHIFWAFGHPEVYILVLPFFGILSEVIPVFSRKPLFGYGFMVGSTVAITVYSFAVWGHHMWAAGMGFWLDIFFAIGTFLIAVPTGVKIFNWIATLWGGSIRLTTAMQFALGVLLMFPIGGVTGVQFAVIPFDRQVTDTYYVVAHLHYVLIGGSVFAAYAGIYYWFPKFTGRLLDERLGKLHFWLSIIALNLTFFIQHVLGWMGMSRRVYTYPPLPGWAEMNMLSTIGTLVFTASVLVFAWNIAVSARRGLPAGDNPWDAFTLEWATSSPPPLHNFQRVPPVRSRRPVWDLNHPEHADWRDEEERKGTMKR
jgi:cytochrome c oxidase subunit I